MKQVFDPEYLARHEMCARDAALRRDALWAADHPNHVASVPFCPLCRIPAASPPSGTPEWDDL